MNTISLPTKICPANRNTELPTFTAAKKRWKLFAYAVQSYNERFENIGLILS